MTETETTEYVVTATHRTTERTDALTARAVLSDALVGLGGDGAVELETVHPADPVGMGAYGESLAKVVADEIERRWDGHDAAATAPARAELFADLAEEAPIVWARSSFGWWRVDTLDGEPGWFAGTPGRQSVLAPLVGMLDLTGVVIPTAPARDASAAGAVTHRPSGGSPDTCPPRDPEEGDHVLIRGRITTFYDEAAAVRVYRSSPVGQVVLMQPGALEHDCPHDTADTAEMPAAPDGAR